MRARLWHKIKKHRVEAILAEHDLMPRFIDAYYDPTPIRVENLDWIKWDNLIRLEIILMAPLTVYLGWDEDSEGPILRYHDKLNVMIRK